MCLYYNELEWTQIIYISMLLEVRPYWHNVWYFFYAVYAVVQFSAQLLLIHWARTFYSSRAYASNILKAEAAEQFIRKLLL